MDNVFFLWCVWFTAAVKISALCHRRQVAYLHNAVTDGAILPLPQKHQADHDHSCYGHCDHQQADQSTAPEAEVLSQGAVWLLSGRTGEKEKEQQWGDNTCSWQPKQ